MKVIKLLKEERILLKAGNLQHQQNLWEDDGTWCLLPKSYKKEYWQQVPKKYRNQTSRGEAWRKLPSFGVYTDWNCGAVPSYQPAWNFTEIHAALKRRHGKNVIVRLDKLRALLNGASIVIGEEDDGSPIIAYKE